MTGFERQFYADVHRGADALERIARALEVATYGATTEDVRSGLRALLQDLETESAGGSTK